MTKAKTFPVEAGWLTLLTDLGVRPADVMRRAGLPDDLLTNPPLNGVGTSEYFNFWSALEALVNDPLFPLRLVEAITPEIFSPPMFAALCSRNFRLAAERLSYYKRLIAPMALDLSVGKQGELTLSPRWLNHLAVPPLVVVVSELAFFIRLLQLGTRKSIRAVQVTMPTLPEPLQEYELYFGTSIRIGVTPSISFSASDAELPFLTANDSMWQIFEPNLRSRLANIDEKKTASDRVRDLLLESIPSGQTSIDTIAGRLAMSKRTLQRRLEEDGVTFQLLLNRTREELVRHYLSKTKLSNGEISFLLGFEDPNSFFRAVHDWTGYTPERLRQALTH